MGEFTDDLYGTDTIRSSMYFYNDGSDGSFGVNPPAVFHTILFGQPVFVPGVSFTDVNNNGVYDPGVDIPLDTARVTVIEFNSLVPRPITMAVWKVIESPAFRLNGPALTIPR